MKSDAVILWWRHVWLSRIIKTKEDVHSFLFILFSAPFFPPRFQHTPLHLPFSLTHPTGHLIFSPHLCLIDFSTFFRSYSICFAPNKKTTRFSARILPEQRKIKWKRESKMYKEKELGDKNLTSQWIECPSLLGKRRCRRPDYSRLQLYKGSPQIPKKYWKIEF